ncbi:MAG: hypothetical protein E6J41_31715 [Chloroflexi bacterium]|nr:MAG: hypothetical protein E6J41_31715 [Chloroflexota bacterium]
MIALIAAGAVLLAGLGVGWGYATQRVIHAITSAQTAQNPIRTVPQIGGSSNNGSSGSSNGQSSGLPAQSGQASQPIDAQAVTGKVSPAIVDINTVIASVNGRTSQAAGTGMILTSTGEILTNHHVVQQANSIKVTIPGHSGSYTATVVGVDPTADVALIKVSGLPGRRAQRDAGLDHGPRPDDHRQQRQRRLRAADRADPVRRDDRPR